MIVGQMALVGVAWILEPMPEGEQGAQLTLANEQGNFVVHVPFDANSLKLLGKAIPKFLNDEERREVSPEWNGGIVLPGKDF